MVKWRKLWVLAALCVAAAPAWADWPKQGFEFRLSLSNTTGWSKQFTPLSAFRSMEINLASRTGVTLELTVYKGMAVLARKRGRPPFSVSVGFSHKPGPWKLVVRPISVWPGRRGSVTGLIVIRERPLTGGPWGGGMGAARSGGRGNDSSTNANGRGDPDCDITGDWYRHTPMGETRYWKIATDPVYSSGNDSSVTKRYRVYQYVHGNIVSSVLGVLWKDPRNFRVIVMLVNKLSMDGSQRPVVEVYRLGYSTRRCHVLSYDGEQLRAGQAPMHFDGRQYWLFKQQ